MGVWGLVATMPGGMDMDLGKVTLVCPCLGSSCVSLSCQDVPSLGPLEMSHPDPGPTPSPQVLDTHVYSPVSPVRSLVNLYCYIASPVCHVS